MLHELLEVLLRGETGTGVEAELHLADLFVDLLHKLKNEVHKFVLVHLLGVEVGEEEADVIVLQGVNRRNQHHSRGKRRKK